MARRLTSALVVESPAGWLLAHRTATAHWDWPKGGVDRGETAQTAALRECWEETGLDLRAHASGLLDTGRQAYRPDRDLQVFFLRVAAAFSLEACVCRAMTRRRTGKPIPDMDAFAWVPLVAVPDVLHPRLVAHAQRHGWLPGGPAHHPDLVRWPSPIQTLAPLS